MGFENFLDPVGNDVVVGTLASPACFGGCTSGVSSVPPYWMCGTVQDVNAHIPFVRAPELELGKWEAVNREA